MAKSIWQWIHMGLALSIGGTALFGLTRAVGPLPALAQTFNPGSGVWATAKVEQLLPQSGEFAIPGLQQKVEVVFDQGGTPHVKAETDRDAWVAIGYLHASNRLFQMDLMRRQGAGLLSEVIGRSALESDIFQRQINLGRSVQAEWAAIPADSEIHEMLSAYATGVNQVIDEQSASGALPMMFHMLGYQPAPWKPQDSLMIFAVMKQMLSLDKMPVLRTLMAEKLGEARVDELYPILPVSPQSPYDEGPYQQNALAELPISAEAYFQQQATGGKTTAAKDETDKPVQTQSVSDVAARFLETASQLPDYALHEDQNSNSWVVDGSKTKSGKPMLASDPHLGLSLPAVWYPLETDSPSYQCAGVSVPGMPFIPIGKNANISWGITNGQTQQVFYYKEQTDEAHPNQYFWQGQWHDMRIEAAKIPVKGEGEETVEIKSTVHGPIVAQDGLALSVNWVGALPQSFGESFVEIMKAKNYEDFKGALQDWAAPALNFTYADTAGNIGTIAAGYYPVLPKEAKPWQVLDGTGESDFIGRIPFADIPQAYNPPTHYIVTANQRQVEADYPYYIGTTQKFDLGNRANRITEVLAESEQIEMDDFKELHSDVKDLAAVQLTPVLADALSKVSLSQTEQEALALLTSWNHRMDQDSAAAAVWGVFWEKYARNTFKPWWDAYKLPLNSRAGWGLDSDMALAGNLTKWTLTDPNNDFFTNPVTHEKRDASTVMVQSFQEAVQELAKSYGNQVSAWKWGSIHTSSIASIAKVGPLGYGPRASSGNTFSVNAAYGGRNSGHGPSWRMIVDMGSGSVEGSYPGGISENPVSPWYTNRVDEWWSGQYSPLQTFEETQQDKSLIRWNLQPNR